MMDGVRVVRRIAIADSIIQMQMTCFLLAGTSSGRSSCCSLIKAIDLHFMVLGQNKGSLLFPELYFLTVRIYIQILPSMFFYFSYEMSALSPEMDSRHLINIIWRTGVMMPLCFFFIIAIS